MFLGQFFGKSELRLHVSKGKRWHESCPLAITRILVHAAQLQMREKSVETSGSGLDSFVDSLGPFAGSEIGRVSDPQSGR